MFNVGPTELFLVLIIVVIIFGVGRLPELGSGLGEGIKNFKKSLRDGKSIDVTPPGNGVEPARPEQKKESERN